MAFVQIEGHVVKAVNSHHLLVALSKLKFTFSERNTTKFLSRTSQVCIRMLSLKLEFIMGDLFRDRLHSDGKLQRLSWREPKKWNLSSTLETTERKEKTRLLYFLEQVWWFCMVSYPQKLSHDVWICSVKTYSLHVCPV